MGTLGFLAALVAGAAALALWVDVRFPRLAPSGLTRRVAFSLAGTFLVTLVPLQPTVASLIGVFLPALCFAFLTALWLLRVLAEPR